MSDEPARACAALKARMQTVQMATVGEDGQPHCGYTPFIQDNEHFIVFVSQLALHTRDMMANARVALMLIDDEQHSKQVFARCRLSLQCEASIIDTQDPSCNTLLDRYEQRHGKMVKLLRQLPDFTLFRLVPVSGQFVMGFGKAYQLQGKKLDEFVHARSA